jgi:hypothetical protein
MVFQDLIQGATNVFDLQSNGFTRVIRVQPGYLYRVVIRQRQAISVKLHYHRRRTWLCLGEGCPACTFSLARSHAFLPASIIKRQEDPWFLLELPASTFYAIQRGAKDDKDAEALHLLGVTVELKRRTTSIRSQVEAFIGPRINVEAAGDLEMAMRILIRFWALPEWKVGQQIEAWRDDLRAYMLNRLS